MSGAYAKLKNYPSFKRQIVILELLAKSQGKTDRLPLDYWLSFTSNPDFITAIQQIVGFLRDEGLEEENQASYEAEAKKLLVG